MNSVIVASNPNDWGSYTPACTMQHGDQILAWMAEAGQQHAWLKNVRKHSSCAHCGVCGYLIPATSPCRLHPDGDCPLLDVTGKYAYWYAALAVAREGFTIPWAVLEVLAVDDVSPHALAEHLLALP